MRTLKTLFVFCFLIFASSLKAQLIMNKDRLVIDEIKFTKNDTIAKGDLILYHIYDKYTDLQDEEFTIEEIEGWPKNRKFYIKKDSSKFYTASYIKENNVLEFILPKLDTARIVYCNKTFKTGSKCETETSSSKGAYSDITEIPLLVLGKASEGNLEGDDRQKMRYMVIDGSNGMNYKNNTIVVKYGDSARTITKKGHLKANSNFSVFIKNYNESKVKDINITTNGISYTYNITILNQLDSLKKIAASQLKKPNADGGAARITVKPEKLSQRTRYLKDTYDKLKGNKFADKFDITRYAQFMKDLRTTIKENKIVLDELGQKYLDSVQSWRPLHVGITPYAIPVPNEDEIKVKMKVLYEDNTEKEHDLGPHRTYGGVSVDYSPSLYFTGLVNNDVYIDSLTTPGQQFARMNTKNQLSIGIGMSTSVAFRTGAPLMPSFDLGVFLPFNSEEITPMLALGPGIKYRMKNANLSFSAGWAWGNINQVAERYQDVDLTNLNLTNESLTEKVWKRDYYISVGMSINFGNN